MPANPPDRAIQDLEALLRDGINAARAGRDERARSLLMQVVERDEGNLRAWLWLSSVVESLEDREVCLENVLTLDPTNEAARRGLAEVRARMAASAGHTGELRSPVPAGGSPAEEAPPIAVAAAAAEPTPPPPPPAELFGDEYRCPFCARPTLPEQRRCPSCGGRLWFHAAKWEERSTRSWMALALQVVCSGLNAAGLVTLLVYVSHKVEGGTPVALGRAYLGLPHEIPAETTRAAFAVVPRPVFLALAFLLLLSLVVLVGIYLRWKPTLYLFLANGAGLAVVGTLTTILLWRTAAEGDDVVTAAMRLAMVALDVSVVLVVFGLALEIREDCFFDRERLLLRLDRSATAGIDFLVHGRRYLRLGMWALAAIHLERAVQYSPNEIDAYLGLAVAHLKLRRHGRAAWALAEARRMDPDDPRIPTLADLLARAEQTG